MMRVLLPFAVCTLFWSPLTMLPARGQEESSELERTLDELSRTIKQAGYVRVGVAPSFLAASAFSNEQDLTVTARGLYLASVVQAGLVTRKGDAYQVLDADVLTTALRTEGIESTQDLDKLKQLAEKIGGLDAIVVGRMATSQDYSQDDGPSSTLQLECKLLEIGTGNVQADKRERRTLTLADEVYAGESIEVLRPTNRGYVPIGFTTRFAENRDLRYPLSPRASAADFSFYQPHPLPNPHCPYRVSVWVNDQLRPFVYDPRLTDIYFPLEFGETFRVEVTNTLDRDVRVAVFVDGLNIRGIRRELPDEKCHAWVLGAGKTGRFRGFYEEAATDAKANTRRSALTKVFMKVPVEDSEAMQAGFTDQLGQITVVIFNSGEPDPYRVIRRSSGKEALAYSVRREWNKSKAVWEYTELWSPTRVRAATGEHRSGIGSRHQETTTLEYREARSGPILAAMTFHYATQAEIDQLIPQD